MFRKCRPSTKVVSVAENCCLTVSELVLAERYLVRFSQEAHFSNEIASLSAGDRVSSGCSLLSLNPFLNSDSVLHVGGRERDSKLSYSRMHPIILHRKHHITKLIVWSEHLRLLHAGSSLVFSVLARRFHILSMKKTISSVVRQCLVCRRLSTKPSPQMLGQLPLERVTPGPVFENVGVDYAGPLQVKYGTVRKFVTVKAVYLCL